MVIYYHSVPENQRERFTRQLDTLTSLAQPVSSATRSGFKPGQRYVCVTFDDGFLSVAKVAAPELARRKIPWTIFVPSGCLGITPDWLRNAGSAARADRVMTADELRALARDPLVTVGSHTVKHANLLEVEPERARFELESSRKELERILEKPVRQFSYPFGARSGNLDRAARECGYDFVFSSEPTFALDRPEAFLNGRVSVDPDIWPIEFRLKILGAYRWSAALRSWKKNLRQ
jgi:peptidoglycan/xylan/chitin deacetylase (PgdA/CDA1 family)